jgi:hypothetical protein
MCPVCATTFALIAAAATTVAGLTALAVKKKHGDKTWAQELLSLADALAMGSAIKPQRNRF